MFSSDGAQKRTLCWLSGTKVLVTGTEILQGISTRRNTAASRPVQQLHLNQVFLASSHITTQDSPMQP